MQLPGLARGPARGPARRAMGSGREGAARASGHPPTPLIGSGREGAARASGQSASRASVLIWSGLQHAIATVCEQSISADLVRSPTRRRDSLRAEHQCTSRAARAWRARPRHAPLKGGVCVRGPGAQGAYRYAPLKGEICVCAGLARRAAVCSQGRCVCVCAGLARKACAFKGRCVCVRVVGSISCSCRRR